MSVDVNFCAPQVGELFKAYIGADGEYALQIRQRTSGVFEYRTDSDDEWRTA